MSFCLESCYFASGSREKCPRNIRDQSQEAGSLSRISGKLAKSSKYISMWVLNIIKDGYRLQGWCWLQWFQNRLGLC